jgi:endonuclease III-like uncharacterized protein
MSNDVNRTENELQSRMEEFRALLKDEAKKQAWHDEIPGSEVLIRFEVFLPSSAPGEEEVDGLFLYMGEKGEIVNAEYYYRDLLEVTVCPLSDEDLEVIKELFKDAFTLEVE